MAEAIWIASREYKVSGSNQTIILRLAAPGYDSVSHYCEFEISGLEEGDVGYRVFGADGIQAIVLTLKTLSAHLTNSAEYKSGRMKIPPVGGLGLPEYEFQG